MAAVCHSCHLAGLKVQALTDTFTLSMKSLRAAEFGKTRSVRHERSCLDWTGRMISTVDNREESDYEGLVLEATG